MCMIDNKFLVSLKFEAYAQLTLAYSGARTIISNITKATLLSNLIQSAVHERNVVLYDKDFAPYSLKELVKIADDHIKGIFNKFLLLTDHSCCKEMEKYKIDFTIGKVDDDFRRNVAFCIISDKFRELKSPDVTNLIKVILVSDDDLADDTGDEGDSERAEIKTSPYRKIGMFERYEKAYSCFDLINKIIIRSIELEHKKQYYKVLYNIQDKIIDHLCNLKDFKKILLQNEKNNHKNDTRQFYEIYTEFIKRDSLLEFIESSDNELIKEYYRYDLPVGNLVRTCIKECSEHCSICYFDSTHCYNKWTKKHLLHIFEELIELNPFSFGNRDFIVELYNKDKNNYIDKIAFINNTKG